MDSKELLVEGHMVSREMLAESHTDNKELSEEWGMDNKVLVLVENLMDLLVMEVFLEHLMEIKAMMMMIIKRKVLIKVLEED